MNQIIGSPVEFEDGDPVEIRAMQLWGTGLGNSLGPAWEASPIYSNEFNTYFWQYYPNGMIACGPGNCACVLYGAIYNYYDLQDEFQGPLGFPTSDVTQLLDALRANEDETRRVGRRNFTSSRPQNRA